MAPPSISNGKVYLSISGTENIGTGQLCVYGLLPSAPPPPAPEKVQARRDGRFVKVTWQASPGQGTYTVNRNGVAVASGLTRPGFTEASAFKGTVAYTVTATDANGQSARSALSDVTIEQAPAPRVMH